MQRKTWAVGDIHGDHKGLTRLMQRMQEDGLDPHSDLVVFLGDMVDGFPYSKDVVANIRTLQWLYGDNVVVLRGNHEQLLLDGIKKPVYDPNFRLWFEQGGQATYESYMRNEPAWDGIIFSASAYLKIPAALKSDMEWFESLPLHHETDDFIFVHAGLRPPFGPQATSDFDKMWIREDFISSNHDWGKRVVFGHTAMEQPLIMHNKLGLDTRARGRGYISGALLTSDIKLYTSS